MRLIRYCRVSSESQADSYGLPSQHKDCRTWATANGHRLVLLTPDPDEVFTGMVEDRPVFGEVIRLIRAGRDEKGKIDGILIPRLDRLARQLTTQEAILAMVWKLGSRAFAADQGEILQDDPDDPMRTAMRQMQGVFAQLERGMLTKRMRDGIKAKRAAGRKATGRYGFGYTGVGDPRHRDEAPDQEEQRAVRLILALRGDGLPYRDICDALIDGGYPTKVPGALWAPMTVKRIFDRETGRPSS